jgi:cAMP-dependent protein kinase regulator
MSRSVPDLSAEEYLTLKGVREFLTRIVASLLEMRPENIERHVFNLLRPFCEPFVPAAAPLTSSPSPLVPATAPAAQTRAMPTAVGRRQSAISPEVLRRASTAGGRRQVLLGRTPPSTTAIQVIPKDPETFAPLEAAVRTVDLFSFLQDDQCHMLVRAMVKREFDDGDMIIREGDQPDNFYILVSGNCRVLKKKDGVDNQVAVLEAVSYFGELALISGSTRAASIIACALSIAKLLR